MKQENKNKEKLNKAKKQNEQSNFSHKAQETNLINHQR